MLTRIKIKNFASIQSLELELDSFHGLVGPNGTGKSTLFNALKFLADIVENGVDKAFDLWGFNYHDLTFCGNGEPITFELEAVIPEELRNNIKQTKLHYFLELNFSREKNKAFINFELFSLLDGPKAQIKLIKHRENKNDLFISEERNIDTPLELDGLIFHFGDQKSTLGNVPPDLEKFRVANWFKEFLIQSLKKYTLDNASLRKVSTSGKGNRLHPTGANLARHLRRIKEKDADLFTAFVEHIQTALPDVKDFIFIDRPEDRAVYFKILYQNGAEVPQWLVSDGSLRLIALSSLAYDPEQSGIVMVEEPENGLHPLAIETVIQSLSSVYGAQVFISTHSPIVMNLIPLAQLLCFSKDENGACHIIKGDQHPVLSQWKDGVNLDAIYAAGILG